MTDDTRRRAEEWHALLLEFFETGRLTRKEVDRLDKLHADAVAQAVEERDVAWLGDHSREKCVSMALYRARAEEIARLTAQVDELQTTLFANGHRIDQAERARDEAHQSVARLRAALERYADRAMWKEVETTFAYAPHEWAFDWPGELGDTPWAIADAALRAGGATP